MQSQTNETENNPPSNIRNKSQEKRSRNLVSLPLPTPRYYRKFKIYCLNAEGLIHHDAKFKKKKKSQILKLPNSLPALKSKSCYIILKKLEVQNFIVFHYVGMNIYKAEFLPLLLIAF